MISLAFRRRHLAAVATLVAVVLVVLVADWLIVSDGEKIDASVRTMRAAVEKGDAAALMANVSADFRSGDGLTREDLAAAAEWFFSAYGPVEFFRFRYDQNRAGDMAVVTVSAIVRLEGGREGTGSSVWDIELRKESDGAWRVTDLAPVRMGGRDAAGWDALPEVRRLPSVPGQEGERVRQEAQERSPAPYGP